MRDSENHVLIILDKTGDQPFRDKRTNLLVAKVGDRDHLSSNQRGGLIVVGDLGRGTLGTDFFSEIDPLLDYRVFASGKSSARKIVPTRRSTC